MRVVLQDTVEVLKPRADQIYLLRHVDDALFALDAGGEDAGLLLELLREPRRVDAVVAEVAAEFPNASTEGLTELVDTLRHHRLVATVADDDRSLSAEDRRRFDRQLAYLATTAPPQRSSAELQRALRDARVVVLGVGGIGSWVAYALSSLGIGVLRLVDADIVDESNLNRQILYRAADVGEPKVRAAQRTIRAFDPGAEVEPCHRRLSSTADVADVIVDADFVVAAVDEPLHQISRWINAACFSAAIPFVTASQVPPLVRVGPTYVPGTTPCQDCQERWLSNEFDLYDELVAQRRHTRPPFTALGPSSGVIGAMIASEVMHHLTGGIPSVTIGQAWILNMQTFHTELQPVRATTRCDLCGQGATHLTRRAAIGGPSV